MICQPSRKYCSPRSPEFMVHWRKHLRLLQFAKPCRRISLLVPTNVLSLWRAGSWIFQDLHHSWLTVSLNRPIILQRCRVRAVKPLILTLSAIFIFCRRFSSPPVWVGVSVGGVGTPGSPFDIVHVVWYFVSKNFCWSLCGRLCSFKSFSCNKLHAPSLDWSAIGKWPLVVLMSSYIDQIKWRQ